MPGAPDVFADAIQADPPMRVARATDSFADSEFECIPIIAHSGPKCFVSVQTPQDSNAAICHGANKPRAASEVVELHAAERADLGLAMLSGVQGAAQG